MRTPESLRPILRARALDALGVQARLDPRMRTGLRRPRVHMVYGHGVAPPDLVNFRALITWLASRFALIGYSEAVQRVLSGTIEEPAVAFSFDDGFRSCLPAADILAEFGVTGCFFICPGLVGATDDGLLSAAFGPQGGKDTVMTWAEVERLRAGGHEIGSHTMTHVDLADVSRDRADDEIGRSFEVLTSRLGGVRHFAWPFGTLRHISPSSARAVFSTGYDTCASAVRGCHVEPVADRTQLCIRREHVQFDWPIGHIRYFLARGGARASAATNGWPDGWHVRRGSQMAQGARDAS